MTRARTRESWVRARRRRLVRRRGGVYRLSIDLCLLFLCVFLGLSVLSEPLSFTWNTYGAFAMIVLNVHIQKLACMVLIYLTPRYLQVRMPLEQIVLPTDSPSLEVVGFT